MSRSGFSFHLAALALCATLLLPSLAEAQQPSFDCAKASTDVERAICGSTMLSTLDRQLATAYSAQRQALNRSERDRLLAEQRSWISNRNRCGGDENCLVAAMEARIAALVGPATASGPSAPSYMGRWQPYGREAVFYSAMTLTPNRLAYDDGLTYDLRQVRPGSNVYRVLRAQGVGPGGAEGECGTGPPTHIAFTMADRFLQLHLFNSLTDPADPPPMTPATLGGGLLGNCSVGSYVR